MDVERIVVRLVADASQYLNTMARVETSLNRTFQTMNAGGADPLAGMNRRLQLSYNRIVENSSAFHKTMSLKSKDFAQRQAEDLEDFMRRREQSLNRMNRRINQAGLFGPQANAIRDSWVQRWNQKEEDLAAKQVINANRFIRNRDRLLSEADRRAAVALGNNAAGGGPGGGRGGRGGLGDEGPGLFGMAWSGVSSVMGTLLHQASRLTVILGTGGLVYATLSAGKAALTLASDYERASVAFEVMTKSATTGKQLLDQITQLAIETPFTSQELIAAAKQVKAFGFDTKDVIPIISRLGDISQGTGGDLDHLILAFGQVSATGRLMGQELRQFTNAGVPILDYLGKVIGVTSSQVPQLVRQGKVGFNDVAKAINMMTNEGGLFAGMMGRINRETVHGRWQNLVESLQLTARNAGLAAFEVFGIRDALAEIGDVVRGSGLEEFKEFFISLKTGAIVSYKLIEALVTQIGRLVKFIGDLKFSGSQNSISDLIMTLGKAALIVGAVVLAMSAWTSISTAAVAAFAFIISPVGLAIVALTALLLILRELEVGATTFNKVWANTQATFGMGWKGLTDAIKAGDIELAFEIAVETIKVMWFNMLHEMAAALRDFFVNVLPKFKVTFNGKDLFKFDPATTFDTTGSQQRVDRHVQALKDKMF